MKILVIEDERQLSEVLVAILQQQQYLVDAVYDGICGEEYALTGLYDIIILDIMLPKKNGLLVLKDLREQGISTPILLLTAKSEVADKISGLDNGADDYLTKPFSSGELLARLRAMTRRKGEYVSDELSLGNLVLDKHTHELSCGKALVKLGTKEYQIMEMLLNNQKQIIPKERFMEKVWGYDADAEYNAIEVYISFIRKKLVAVGSNVQIKAIRGSGYALEVQQ